MRLGQLVVGGLATEVLGRRVLHANHHAVRSIGQRLLGELHHVENVLVPGHALHVAHPQARAPVALDTQLPSLRQRDWASANGCLEESSGKLSQKQQSDSLPLETNQPWFVLLFACVRALV